jgi:hypothetical protein
MFDEPYNNVAMLESNLYFYRFGPSLTRRWADSRADELFLGFRRRRGH